MAGMGHVTLALWSPLSVEKGAARGEQEQGPLMYTVQGRSPALRALRTGKVLERTNEGAGPNQEKRKWARSAGKPPGAHLRKWFSGCKVDRLTPGVRGS